MLKNFAKFLATKQDLALPQNRLLAPVGPNPISKHKYEINWRAWQYKRLSQGSTNKREYEYCQP
jgi:hypothetical protein